MTSNKHADFRKIESFVGSKCYSEDISKDKRKKANFKKYCKNFEIIGHHLTSIGKRRLT